MNWRKNIWFKAIPYVLTFSFLIASPSQATLTDALKPAKTDYQDIKQIGTNIAEASTLSLTDPEKIIIAENLGRIREIFKGENGRLIINIQDAHCNFEAQTNISNILDSLVKNGLRIVALEGSTGEIDPSIFTTFPDEDIRKEVATYFMKKGKINGAEYLAITSKNPPQLYGVETKEYYLANLATFLNTLKDRDKIKRASLTIKNVLDRLKDRIYPKTLKELDIKAPLNKEGKIDLLDYCRYLKQTAESKRLSLERFPNLGLLYKTIGIEETINFDKVESERANIITILEKSLSSDEELEELFAKSMSFKNGQISAEQYHVYLRGLAQAKRIDFTKYANLTLYTEYLIIYEKIDSPSLLKEITALEDAVKEKLFTSDDQRALDKLSKNIRLLDSMLNIAMSREDVEYYQRNKNDFRSLAFIDFIKTQGRKYKITPDYDPNFALVDKYLPELESFYHIAETRDDAILENTLKKMDEENIQVVALITGGYHTQGISERLRARGISYIVIAPRITKQDNDNPYLSILSSEKVSGEISLKEDQGQLAINSALERNGVNARNKGEFAKEVDEYYARLQKQRKADLQYKKDIAAPLIEKTKNDYAAWDDADYSRRHDLEDRVNKMAEIFTKNMRGLNGSPAPWCTALLQLIRDEILPPDNPVYKALSEILLNLEETRITHRVVEEAVIKNGGDLTDVALLKKLTGIVRESAITQLRNEFMKWESDEKAQRIVEPWKMEAKLSELEGQYGLAVFSSSWLQLYREFIIRDFFGRQETDRLYLAIGDLIDADEQGEQLSLGDQVTGQPGGLDIIFLSRGANMEDWELFNKAAFGPGSGCGIMAYFGFRGGTINVLEAAGRLSYRAPDSTGVAAVATRRGDIVLRRQLKTPVELIQFLYWNPMFEEATIMTEAGEVSVASLSQAELNARRMSLLLGEGIELGNLQDLSFKPDGTGYTMDNLYGFRRTGEAVERVQAGIGVAGNATSNMSYDIDKDLNVARFLMQQYGFSSKMLRINFKEALRHALADRMGLSIKDFDARMTLFNKIISNKAPANSLTAKQKDEARFAAISLENFEKVITQAILGNLNEANKPIWNDLWNKVLNGRKIIVTADFDNDAVRHAFRLVASNIVAPMAVWSYIEQEVETRFKAKVAGTSYGNKRWREAWMEEAAFNTPGRAFESAVEWFQYKNIPQDHWNKVTFGRVGGITAELMVEMVSGHGRWGMMGGITIANAHPHPDSKFNRALTLNGALNVNTFARLRKEQAGAGYAHRSENDTEVIVYEIEKTFDEAKKSGQQISDEEATRRALHRIREGSEMAVSVLSKYSPGAMYVASYNRPVAIVIKGGEIIVSSDLNAALGLWPAPEVEEAVREITVINTQANEAREEARQNIVGVQELDARLKQISEETDAKIAEITKRFKGEAIFLEGTGHGQFAKIYKTVNDKGEVEVRVDVSDFEGNPVDAKKETVEINPAQVGKGTYSTFLEYHIHEIPGIQRKILDNYITADGRVKLDATWSDDQLLKAGLNVHKLQERFGEDLHNLKRIFLVGVGSSYRDAMAAKVFLESVLPEGVEVLIYDPVEILNKGVNLNPRTDLAVNITWSGTTASIKKAHEYFAQNDVMDLTLTGKIQSDLARVTREIGGAIDVLSGIEVSVCTVKGYESILFTHMLLGLQLGQLMHPGKYYHDEIKQLREIPKMVEDEIDSDDLKNVIDRTADRFKAYTKVVVMGTQPVDLEGELKMEEVNWIVGAAFDPDDTSAWDAIEKSARMPDEEKAMVIVNATDENRLEDMMWAMERLEALGVPYAVHTYSNKYLNRILQFKSCEGHVYVGNKVSKPLQSLIDAPFYFQLALALAKAKGIPPEGTPSIDICRNLTKSVVVTGAEAQAELERQASEFKPITVQEFAQVEWQHGYEQYLVDMQHPVFETPDQEIIAGQPIATKTFIDTSVKDTSVQIEGINTGLLKARFGKRLDELKKVIIVTDEEVTQNAASATQSYFENILGVRAEVCRSHSIPKYIDKHNTLAIAIGRSNRRHGTRNSLPAPIQRLHDEDVAVAVIADTFSPVYATGKLNAGCVSLKSDLDELSMYEASYLNLATMALKLSELKGVEGLAEYVHGLKVLPYNIARVIQNRKLMGQVKEVAAAFKEYSKVHIIGGAQSYATAQELARNLRRQGILAEAQYNDSAWHGPLAVVNPDENARPTDNTLIIVLATVSNFKLSSLLDSQVYNTRNAKIVLVVQEGEDQIEGVNSVGAYSIIAVPKAPDIFTNPSDVVFAQMLATEYGMARGQDGNTLAKPLGVEKLDGAAKTKVLKERGLTETDEYYITKDGGKIAKDVNLLNIDPTATISGGSVVSGKATVIGKNVTVEKNSLVVNSKIGVDSIITESKLGGVVVGERTTVSTSVLLTVDKKEKWKFSGGSPYRVSSDSTVTGNGVTIKGQSEIINSFIGDKSLIIGSPVYHSEIGASNEIVDGKVMLTHTEHHVKIKGPTEVSESWIGFGLEIIKLAYVEGIFPNKIFTLDRDAAGNIVPATWENIPNIASIGRYATFSGYDGTPAHPEGGVLTEITGKEKSAHGTPLIFTAAVIGPDTNLIALKGHPDLDDPMAIFEDNLTYLSPFSVCGFHGYEAWGNILPGELREGLSPRQTTLAWMFTYAPSFIVTQMHNMVSKIRQCYPQNADEMVKKLDGLPEAVLKTSLILVEKEFEESTKKLHMMAPDSPDAKKIKERQKVVARGIKSYRAHLTSGAWTFTNGRFENVWGFDHATKLFKNSKFDVEKLLHNKKARQQYKQYTIADLMSDERQIDHGPWQDVLRQDELKAHAAEPYIAPGVQVHPTAMIIGSRLEGVDTKVGPNAVLWRSYLRHVDASEEDVTISNSIAVDLKVGKGANITNSRLSSSEIGEGVNASYNVADRSVLKKDAMPEPGGIFRNTVLEPGAIGGSKIFDSVVGRGGVDHHWESGIFNADMSDFTVEVEGEEKIVVNVTNVPGGAVIGSVNTKEQKVVLRSAFIASNTVIHSSEQRAPKIGFCSFVKHEVLSNEDLFPFTMKRGLGADKDEIGGVLDKPGLIIRHLLSKSVAKLPPGRKSDIDGIVEHFIREAVTEAQLMLVYAEAGNHTRYTVKQLREGISRLMRNLDGRWKMKDCKFAEGVWLHDEATDAWTWKPHNPDTGAGTANLMPEPNKTSTEAIALGI